MRIGVDGRDLTDQAALGLRQARGIARYASSLLGTLAADHPEHTWVVALPAGGPQLALPGVEVRRQRLPRRPAGLAAATIGRPRVDRLLGDVDVLWLPAPAPVAVSARVPYVLTVHDLSTELRQQDLAAYPRLWSRLTRARRLARQARAVMVDSESTHTDVLTHWGLAPERVTLVRPGVWHPEAGGRLPAGVPADYLLYVGALEPRKGLDVLGGAYARARAVGLRSSLVVVGDGPVGPSLDAPGVVRTGRVSDLELAALYAGALATVLPSHMEGFGFTPLESLAAGTPVVVSDLPPLRETLGEAAVFVPAGDAEALAGAIGAIAGDGALRDRLMAAAPDALAPLTWRRAADRTMAVLLEAARA